MKFKIISTGKRRSNPTDFLVNDYIKRIEKFIPVSDTVLKPGDNKALTDRVKKESKGSTFVVALDEGGRMCTSVQFSRIVKSWMNSGQQSVLFAIGGADGLCSEILEMADETISLSRMTLPHRFARLLLAEQLYRALCIEKNLPYHK